MSNLPISSLHRYAHRFLRSTDLVRDFEDPNGLQGYCLTDFGKSCVQRLIDGFRPLSTQRAWRLTGDFGSGKSSFALFLAKSFHDPKRSLPSHLYRELTKEFPEATTRRYVPILVIGNRERIAPAILRAVLTTFRNLFSRGVPSSLELEIAKALSSAAVSDSLVLDLIRRANAKIIESGKGQGMLFLLDEVGKFLEFAVHNPEQQDVYLLQQLAETACRSGKQPIIVICLLHQGFNAYAQQLTESSQREWEKISGRFDEITFQQPIDQIAVLIASALNVDIDQVPGKHKSEALACLNECISWGWFGTSSSRETLRKVARLLFPISPIVLPVLVRAFQRFGQNERSLFGFLGSHEPFGLRAFSNARSVNQSMFRLADFYDYIRASFGHRLAVASYRTHWNVIESLIEAQGSDDGVALEVLKTVGVVNLLNAEDIRATRDAICWAIGGSSNRKRSEVAKALKRLVAKRLLHYRGEGRGYSIWAYTSVDLDGRYQDAKRAIPEIDSVSKAVKEQLDTRPIVARAHYIKTGNLRYFAVIFCHPEQLVDEDIIPNDTRADGVILVPLCETRAETESARAIAAKIPPRSDLIVLTAVPRPLNYLHQAALDAQRWEWVQANTSALNSDPLARDEVQVHLQEARNRLQGQLHEFIGLNRISGRSTLSWFYRGQCVRVRSGRELMRWLSALCDEIFTAATTIRNELVNRHNLSAAANAARIRLIDLMFTSSDKPDLGIPPDRKPPEKSMYFSVLKATGLHGRTKQRWKLCYPSSEDTGNLAPALNAIRNAISSKPDTRIPINDLLGELRRPPYGLRDGLFPILLALVAIVDEQEIAFYENGTFLREVGRDAFLRMTKAPDKFDIQYCKVAGVRSELFTALVRLLELPNSTSARPQILDVVRKLCEFVAKLPEYTRTSRELTKTAMAVRDVIIQAREPVHLIFHDLPPACDLPEFEIDGANSSLAVQEFAIKLKTVLRELTDAYGQLHKRIASALSVHFGYDDLCHGAFRERLTHRAEQLLKHATEIRLKGFALRLAEKELTDFDWIESIGSFLALTSPSRWTDRDEATFHRELRDLAGRFNRAESAAFAIAPGTIGLRVALTEPNGAERREVFQIDDGDRELLRELETEIQRVIVRNKRIGIVAASRAMWSHMTPAPEHN